MTPGDPDTDLQPGHHFCVAVDGIDALDAMKL
jgi:hypothetical protein